MLFSYKAKSKNGELVDGILESADRFALSRELRSRELTPVSIAEKNSSYSFNLMAFLNNFFTLFIGW